MRYIIQWRYKSGKGGPWEAGESIDLADDVAAAINGDSPGVLVPEAEVPTRAIDAAPHDRMVRASGRKRAGAGA